MAQTTKAITDSAFTAVRSTEAGDRYLVLSITYDDATEAEIVLPVETVVPS